MSHFIIIITLIFTFAVSAKSEPLKCRAENGKPLIENPYSDMERSLNAIGVAIHRVQIEDLYFWVAEGGGTLDDGSADQIVMKISQVKITEDGYSYLDEILNVLVPANSLSKGGWVAQTKMYSKEINLGSYNVSIHCSRK